MLRSTTASGRSRIRAQLTEGSAVTTIKTTVDRVVAEWGIAMPRGHSIAGRARALISIAHPDHRETLARAATELGLLPVRRAWIARPEAPRERPGAPSG